MARTGQNGECEMVKMEGGGGVQNQLPTFDA